MSRAIGLAIVPMFAVLATSCAHQMGSRATAGAMEQMVQQKSNAPQEEQIMRIAAERAVQGALDELAGPERRAQFQDLATAVAAAAADAAARDFARRLVIELGPDGEGPLAASITGTGQRISAAVVGGARAELAGLFPDCEGPDTMGCIEKRVEGITRSAGAGFARGMRDSIGWPLLILAGFLGLVLGILGHWLWSLRIQQQRVLRTT